jgi:hypothetical protein
MKLWQGVLSLLLGVAIGFFGGRFWTISPVHAQGQSSETGLCTTTVPKSWGDFRGASAYGLAFEDDAGTVRLMRNPSCDSGISSAASGYPTVDLKVERK